MKCTDSFKHVFLHALLVSNLLLFMYYQITLKFLQKESVLAIKSYFNQSLVVTNIYAQYNEHLQFIQGVKRNLWHEPVLNTGTRSNFFSTHCIHYKNSQISCPFQGYLKMTH